MVTRKQLKHPAGKKAVSMDREKYEMMKKAVLSVLKSKGELTHTDLLHEVNTYFKEHTIKFTGAVGWNMEWVKLDLEARKQIMRSKGDSPAKFKAI
jgi:hypothetical protein